MTLWILDTDHLSLLQRGDPLVEQRISTIDPDDIAITIISVEEQLYGRLNQIRRAKSLESLSSAYGFLRDTLDSFSNANILDFDKAATSCYEALLHQKIRKRPQVSQSTLAVDYRKYRNHIASQPTKSLDDAIAIRDYLVSHLSPNAAKRVLTNLSACCSWAEESKLIDTNPFAQVAAKVKLPKADKKEEYDIHPFTSQERDIIIQAFEEDKHYSYYAPLVNFLFYTGCRPSEAIALQWRHIGEKFINFKQAITISLKGLALKEGLKTQDQRKFPINAQLQTILQSIRPESYQESEFIFCGKKGGIIDFGDFCNHAWKGYKNRHGKIIEGIVTRLVREGKVDEYRKPYQCRHTFITLCLESGIDCKDVARWVGNSPEVIYRHYAGNRRDLQML